jgi:hypothetical protein
MKKGLLILLAVISVAVSSCSKDAKINRRIDGEWKVVSIGSDVITSEYAITMSFKKDEKKNGTGTFIETYNGMNETTAFTYNVADEKISLIVDGTVEILTVKTYEKDKVELIDLDNDVWVLDPK